MTAAIQRASIHLAALGLVLLAAGSQAGAGPGRVPDLDGYEKLQVPEGNNVAYVTYAEGVQIYRWNGAAWGFVAPEAVLYDADGAEVGTHYAGPTWESDSGSKVVGRVLERATPDPTAIPWLKLEAASSDGPGVFHRVTFIQRLYTVGGLAPSNAGDAVGEEARVPYSTWYVFYRAE